MNKVILIGRLGKDPELTNTTSGKTVAKFSVATTHGYGEGQKTEWHNAVAWEKLADLVGEYLSKGSKVAVEGRIQTRSYEAKDGTKKYVTEIVATSVEFLDPKDDSRPSGKRTSKEKEDYSDDVPF